MKSELTGKTRHRLGGLFSKKMILQVEVREIGDFPVYDGCHIEMKKVDECYWRDAELTDFSVEDGNDTETQNDT